MFDCQMELSSPFFYLGRSDDDCLTLSGKQVEKLSLKRAPCKANFNKDIFCKSGRKQCQFTHAVFLFHLAGNGCFRQKQVFVFLKKYTVSARVFPGLVF